MKCKKCDGTGYITLFTSRQKCECELDTPHISPASIDKSYIISSDDKSIILSASFEEANGNLLNILSHDVVMDADMILSADGKIIKNRFGPNEDSKRFVKPHSRIEHPILGFRTIEAFYSGDPIYHSYKLREVIGEKSEVHLLRIRRSVVKHRYESCWNPPRVYAMNCCDYKWHINSPDDMPVVNAKCPQCLRGTFVEWDGGLLPQSIVDKLDRIAKQYRRRV